MNEKKPAKVYIDGANVFYAQRKLGWSLDWRKTKKYIERYWPVVEWRYYTGVKPDDEKMTGYLKMLDEVGFTVLTKPLKKILIDREHPLAQSKGYQYIYKSNFDVEIATDLAFDRAQLETILLFSGDSDFEYIVRRLQAVGKRVVVFSSRRTLSWELKIAAAEYRFLEDIGQKIALDRK